MSENQVVSITIDNVVNGGYLLFLGEYQIYFIECVENISNLTNAKHE